MNSLLCKYSLINKQTKMKTSSMYLHLIFQTGLVRNSVRNYAPYSFPKPNWNSFIDPWPEFGQSRYFTFPNPNPCQL